MGEIFEYFKDMTEQDILLRLMSYRSQAQSLITQIEANELAYQQTYYLEIMAWNNMTHDRSTAASIAHKALVNARAQYNLAECYKKGYLLLNEIGHAFHGDWKYSVTIKDKNGEMITFELNEMQFLSITDSNHLGQVTLLNNNSILQKMADAQIEGTKWSNAIEKNPLYNQSVYEAYAATINYAKGIISVAGEKTAQYNAGQILEGYFALSEKQNLFTKLVNMMDELQNSTDRAKKQHLGHQAYNFMRTLINNLRIQTNSRGFWSGPDTQSQGQVKGAGASVFQNATIVNQLSQFIALTEKLNFSNLQEALNSTVNPKLRRSLKNSVTDYINQIMAGFDATRVSQAQFTKIDELSNDIESLIQNLI